MTAQQDLILAANAGSSSLKLAIFNLSKGQPDACTQLYQASFSNLFTKKPSFTFSSTSVDSPAPTVHSDITEGGNDHKAAFSHFLQHLKNIDFDEQRIKVIGHRVVHGGSMDSPTIITADTMHHLEELSDLAPLHNGPALSVIETCLSSLPASKSYALFDTSFHHTIPPHIYSYAIDQSVAKAKGLRKYGFHGLSYSYINRTVSSALHIVPQSQNLIVLHLGSGASICAIKHGQSLDTTMGLTPLSGLPGSSRSGSIDPSLIFHYTSDAGKISHSSTKHIHLTEAEQILNKESGWKALTDSSDFSEIANGRASPDSPESLAYNIFIDRILSYLGSYILKLGGPIAISGIVFSGGIGENSPQVRKSVIDACTCVGLAPIDEDNNDHPPASVETTRVYKISHDGMEGVPSFVCFTDEQFEMARILIESSVDATSR